MPSGVYKRKTSEELFWSKVEKNKNGCWLWQASLIGDGYGHFHVNRVGVLAHRYSYELFNGVIPDGYIIRHKCNIRRCVNPAHLIIGTQKDNVNDAVYQKRHCHGVTHGCSILSEKDVTRIRTSKLTTREIAVQYNISYHTAWDIIKRRSWKHLK